MIQSVAIAESERSEVKQGKRGIKFMPEGAQKTEFLPKINKSPSEFVPASEDRTFFTTKPTFEQVGVIYGVVG